MGWQTALRCSVHHPTLWGYLTTYTDIAIGCTTSNQLWLEEVLDV
jgi:hypothetical protein